MNLLIKHRKRDQPRGSAALRRQIRYLLSPKASKVPARLLGPPYLCKLALSHTPWGDEINAAADQLTEQMLRYCRAARAGQSFPKDWFVHALVTFRPGATRVLKKPSDPHDYNPPWESAAQNAYRIARDALDYFGWTPNRPTLMVAHADRRHIHVHVIAAIPVLDDEDWDILKVSRRHLNEIAKICAGAYRVPVGAAQHRKWRHLVDFEPAMGRPR